MASTKKHSQPQRADEPRDMTITIRLTAAQHAAIEKLAASDERSMGYVIRKAIDNYIELKRKDA